MLRHYAGAALNRYHKLHIAGKVRSWICGGAERANRKGQMFIWFLVLFYISFGGEQRISC